VFPLIKIYRDEEGTYAMVFAPVGRSFEVDDSDKRRKNNCLVV
jgi:hypothetical protein